LETLGTVSGGGARAPEAVCDFLLDADLGVLVPEAVLGFLLRNELFSSDFLLPFVVELGFWFIEAGAVRVGAVFVLVYSPQI